MPNVFFLARSSRHVPGLSAHSSLYRLPSLPSTPGSSSLLCPVFLVATGDRLTHSEDREGFVRRAGQIDDKLPYF